VDGFGISYQRIQVVELHVLDEQEQQIQTRTATVSAASAIDEEDDEFAVFDGDNVSALQDTLKLIVQKKQAELEQEASMTDHERFNEFSHMTTLQSTTSSTLDSGDGFVFTASMPSIDEPLLLHQSQGKHKDEAKILVTGEAAQQQLREIVDIYASGMGDQEVLLLDSDGGGEQVSTTSFQVRMMFLFMSTVMFSSTDICYSHTHCRSIEQTKEQSTRKTECFQSYHSN
jgi:hypothetical protein